MGNMTGFLFILVACALWALDTLIRYPLIGSGVDAVRIVFYEHLILTIIFSTVFFKSFKNIWNARTSHYFYFFVDFGKDQMVHDLARITLK